MDDLIKRADAIEEAGRADVDMSCYTFEKIKSALMDIPAVDAELVRRGTWVTTPKAYVVKCSECGNTGFPEWKLCPNCGARMTP